MGNCGSNLPNDPYIFRITDCTGMFQHAVFSVPDPSEGYTTDDNARALIMAEMLYQDSKDKKYLELAYCYLRFLLYAENDGWFRNFMDYSRSFLEKRGSPDCFGRCIWALGFTIACPEMPERMRSAAECLLRKVLPSCKELAFLRSKAYAAIGLSHWDHAEAQDEARHLVSDLADAYQKNRSQDWYWYENNLSYCNAVLPGAMLVAYDMTKENKYLEIATESLDFLLKSTFRGNIFHPIGCNGWLFKGKEAAEYDQQPVEACGTLLTCLKAFQITGKQVYLDRAQGCLNWYTGQNSLGESMIDPESGGCLDGIRQVGQNPNEGAESIVSWMVAALAFRRVSQN